MGCETKNFGRAWLVSFDRAVSPGERPTPTGLVAREYITGKQIAIDGAELQDARCPYPLDADSLVVTYDAPAVLGCHLVLGWPMPANVIDLHAEYRCQTAGLDLARGDDVQDALDYFGVAGDGPDVMQGLLDAMLPRISLGHALLRGRYTAAVARMEDVGIPIDVETLDRLRQWREPLLDALIRQADEQYGVFDGNKFNCRRWQAWVNRNRIPWPRSEPGRLDLSLEAFRDMAKAYPVVRPMQELQATLAQLRSAVPPAGHDGRNRCQLRPFATKTGRNAPSTTQFVFGPATWIRGLIKPQEGMAVAYVDYEQQEFGIAAALSSDEGMKEAYCSGDPYLTFAQQARAVPAGATKATHGHERDQFKQCALGVQYGMTAKGLGRRLRISPKEAQRLLRLHKDTYPRYWHWSDKVVRQGRKDGKLQSVYGWTRTVGKGSKSRSLRNFPLQANGAEMLRLACCVLTEAGARVCAPVHDAVLIEARENEIEEAVAYCQDVMAKASEAVLPGFQLRTEAKVVRYPDRYMDARGKKMWATVTDLLGQVRAA
ncbi:MAG TPA: DNA polymerase [Gemmataceae bacterium]|nr:DNA polymerase [Gemmataceae bacterium]